MWDILLENDEEAKISSGSVPKTMSVCLQTEYMGTQKTRMILHRVLMDLTKEQLGLFFWFGQVGNVSAVTTQNGHCDWVVYPSGHNELQRLEQYSQHIILLGPEHPSCCERWLSPVAGHVVPQGTQQRCALGRTWHHYHEHLNQQHLKKQWGAEKFSQTPSSGQELQGGGEGVGCPTSPAGSSTKKGCFTSQAAEGTAAKASTKGAAASTEAAAKPAGAVGTRVLATTKADTAEPTTGAGGSVSATAVNGGGYASTSILFAEKREGER